MEVIDVRPEELKPIKHSRMVVCPHPLTTQGRVSEVVVIDGQNLLELLAPYGVDETWMVTIGGVPVSYRYWALVRPKHGQIIECRRFAQSDAGDFLKLLAVVAVIYFAGAYGSLATFMGASATEVLIAKTVIYVAGMALVNKLFPNPKPPTRSTPESVPTYSLTGNNNRLRTWECLPMVFGETYCVPDMASQPYTSAESGEQYLTQIFMVGVNTAAVRDIKIGENLTSTYSGVSLHYDNFSGIVDTGMPASNVDSINGGLLDAPGAPGPWVTRTTSINTLRAVIEIEAQLFSVDAQSGSYQEAACDLDIQYRLVGSSTWLDRVTPSTETYVQLVDVYGQVAYGTMGGRGGGGGNVSYVTEVIRQDRVINTTPNGKAYLRNASSKLLRVAYAIAVANGQYEIRVRKASANANGTSSQNTINWTTLKSYQAEQASHAGMQRFAMRIQASGQLNGSLEAVNCIAVAEPIPYWNGSAWVTATSAANGLSNPGAQILAFARGYYAGGRLIAGLGWPDSMIDIEGLKQFMVWCAAKNFTCNYYLQETMSTLDVLSLLAACGMGQIHRPDGMLGVTWLADTAPIEGVINMANIKADSFSVSYPLLSRADELEYGFFDAGNSNTWKSLRVSAPGVATPSKTARLNNAGVTTEAHAAMLARFVMGQNIYMAKTVELTMDTEAMIYRLNQVVALSHDLTQWGYGGRVNSVSNNNGILTFGLDAEVPAGSGSRYVGLRLQGEMQMRVFSVAAFSGTARSLTLATAWPAGVTVPAPMEALWCYDFKATPGARMVITSMEFPTEDNIKLSLSPLPDEFWDYVLRGSYTPPPNISLLAAKPTASNLVITETLKKNGLSYIVELTLTFDITGPYGHSEIWAALSTGAYKKIGDTTTREFTFTSALDESWYFEVRPFSGLGLQGNKAVGQHLVIGLSLPPPTPTNFSVTVASNGVLASWDDGRDGIADYKDSILKSGSTWATGVQITRKSTTTHLLGWLSAGTQQFLLKHVDAQENESVTEAAATITINPPATVVITRSAVQNNVLTLGWADAKTSQPIKSYALWFADGLKTFAEAGLFGKAGADSRSDLMTFTSSGPKRVWLVAEDVAGNTSTPAVIDINVTMPANFVLADRYNGSFPGTLTNAVFENNAIYLPLTNLTWQQHITNTGYQTLQADISAGQTLWFQPAPTVGSYQDLHDCGKVLTTAIISVVVSSITLIGSVTPVVQIETSTSSAGPWVAAVNGATEVVASDFQFVRVTYTVTGVGGDDLVAMNAVTVSVRLEPKEETVAMTLTTAAQGTPYSTTVGFNDITGVVFTPSVSSAGGSTPLVRATAYWNDAVSPPVVYVMGFDINGNRVAGTGTAIIKGL